MTESAATLLEEQLTPRSTRDKPRLMRRDIDVERFILDVIEPRETDFDVAGKIVAGDVTRTIEGASTLTVTIHDVERALMNSGSVVELIERSNAQLKKLDPYIRLLQAVDVKIDGYFFRLVAISKQGDDFTFTFEDRDVARMRLVTKPYKVRRKSMTRAQFVHSMVKQTPGEEIIFWCPDEDEKQDISGSGKKKHKKKQDDPEEPRRNKGVVKKTGLKVGESVATESQRSVMEEAIAEGSRQNASFKVLVAGAITVIQESRARTDVTPDGVHVGAFQQDARYWPATRDVTKDAKAFFERAKKVAKAHPEYSAGTLAIATQLPGFASQSQYSADQYGQWKEQGEAWVRAYSGNTKSSGSETTTKIEPYEFKRGEDGSEEDSWQASLRLAEEVNWGCYMTNGVMVFASEERLMASQPWAIIAEGEDGVDTIDWDIDYGKRTQVATVTAHIDRWDAVPGFVVVIDDLSPAGGRWLVSEVNRPLFSSIATITLKRPTPAKPEPRASRSSTTTDNGEEGDNVTGGKFTGRLADGYKEAQRIDAKDYPYSYGGGHGAIGRPSVGTDGQLGYDCSGYVSAILHAMGLLDSPVVSGAMATMFQPGEGKYFTVYANAAHCFTEFRQPGGEWEHWGTGSSVPGGGPGHQNYIHTHSGFAARHPKGM